MLIKTDQFGMSSHAISHRSPNWVKTGKSEIEKAVAHDRKKQEKSKEKK